MRSQRPSGAGTVSAISCRRGCMYSAISRIWPFLAFTSSRTRSKRLPPDLQLGDADRVLVGHAEREIARGLGEEPIRAVAGAASSAAIGSSRSR